MFEGGGQSLKCTDMFELGTRQLPACHSSFMRRLPVVWAVPAVRRPIYIRPCRLPVTLWSKKQCMCWPLKYISEKNYCTWRLI